MSQDLSEIISSDSSFDHVAHIQKHLGSETRTAQDLVRRYLENVDRVSNSHEEVTGGTIDKFEQLALRRDNIQNQLAGADQVLEDTSSDARSNINREAAIEVAKMTRHFKVLQQSNKLYQNYDTSDSGSGPSTIASAANSELGFLLNLLQGDDQRKSREIEDMFFTTQDSNGEFAIGVNPDKLDAFFESSTLGPEKLKDILNNGTSGEKSIEDQIAEIDKKLEEIKENPEYDVLEGLKAFSWKSIKDYCTGNDALNPRKINNSQCVEEDFSQIDNLLEVGNQIISHQSNQEDRFNLNAVNDSCTKLRNHDRELFNSNYSEICSEVASKQVEMAKANEYYSNDARRERFRRQVNYDSSGENPISEYKSKSWAQLLPGALTHAMPAGMRLGQTWVNTYGIKSQMLGYKTYAENRYNYLEQQYNQGVAICNTTMNCYFNSQYQSFLPSYGGGVTNLGTGAFTPNTSNFFAQ